jgi:spore maturation protein CgeB
LWGNGWSKHEKYKRYAMGIAENGEQLSKIYQCSKINVGNNIYTTSASRAWESMLSGGFYMSNYIPEENDASDIRKILKENEFVIFYDKDDFLLKVKYYLENEDKRLEMIEIERKCALERMTFEELMKKTIKNIGDYYRKGN